MLIVSSMIFWISSPLAGLESLDADSPDRIGYEGITASKGGNAELLLDPVTIRLEDP